MTYALIVLPFLLITVVVTLATLRRPAFARRMGASGIAALALIALTAVFDNAMIVHSRGAMVDSPLTFFGTAMRALPERFQASFS